MENKKDFLFHRTSSGEIKPYPIEIEHIEIINGYAGGISLHDKASGKVLGGVTYNTIKNQDGQKNLHFEGLSSNVEGLGVGTKLILELIKISQEIGAEGCLSANASPYRNSNDSKQSLRPLTNMEFYYKLGFNADDKVKDKEIRELLEKGEHIPLRLNVFTDISLSKEAAERLQQREQRIQQAFANTHKLSSSNMAQVVASRNKSQNS